MPTRLRSQPIRRPALALRRRQTENLSGRRADASELPKEELQISLNPSQKAGEIGFAAHIRRVTGLQGWAVIGQGEDALSVVVEQNAGDALGVAEGASFRGQPNPLEQSGAGKCPGQP